MINSTVLAAAIAAAQPQPAPQAAMDHGSMDHSKMDHSKMDMKAAKPGAKMDCCKDGCACCAKDKAAK